MAKRKVTIGVIAAAILILLAWFMYFITWTGDTTELKETAESFKPPANWQLQSKRIYPDKNVHIEGPINEADYTWASNQPVTKKQLTQALQDSGMNYPVKGECDASKAPSGTGATVCSAEGQKDGFKVGIFIHATRDKPDQATVQLNIKGE